MRCELTVLDQAGSSEVGHRMYLGGGLAGFPENIDVGVVPFLHAHSPRSHLYL